MQTVPTSLITATARPALEAGLRAIESGDAEFDLAGVTELDSAAVAMLLAWQRAAHAHGLTLRLTNVPAGLHSLAGLYGVAELLPR